jgi:hypothetical protein
MKPVMLNGGGAARATAFLQSKHPHTPRTVFRHLAAVNCLYERDVAGV